MGAIDIDEVRDTAPQDIDELAALIKANANEKQAYILRCQVFINWLTLNQDDPVFIRKHAERLAGKFEEMVKLMSRFSEQEYPALYLKIREMRELMAKAKIHFHFPGHN